MLACILIPGFELRAALRARSSLLLEPAALAPLPGSRPAIGAVTATAEAQGVRPGMLLSEALGMCPSLVLVEQDAATVELLWEEILRSLENEGFAVEPAGPGCLYLDTRAVERLYGGVKGVLDRALAAIGSGWDARAGAAERKFTALAAASIARAGQALVVSDEETPTFLAPLPLSVLPLERERHDELIGLGVRTVGELAALRGAAAAERFGKDGREAWGLARGGGRSRLRPRRPPAEIMERIEFPEPVDNELTLRRTLAALVERTLAQPERAGRAVRKAALSARLVGGGSWRRTLTLREPAADRDRLRIALGPKLAGVSGPVTALALELTELTGWTGRQLELVRPEGEELRALLGEGLRQVRASAGAGAVARVVEVAPWSRVPEHRALLVPRDG